jgi:hypothetical protein
VAQNAISMVKKAIIDRNVARAEPDQSLKLDRRHSAALLLCCQATCAFAN